MEQGKSESPADASAEQVQESWEDMIASLHEGVLVLQDAPTIDNFARLSHLLRAAMLQRELEPEKVAKRSAFFTAELDSHRHPDSSDEAES
jgi:hypothetical protein